MPKLITTQLGNRLSFSSLLFFILSCVLPLHSSSSCVAARWSNNKEREARGNNKIKRCKTVKFCTHPHTSPIYAKRRSRHGVFHCAAAAARVRFFPCSDVINGRQFQFIMIRLYRIVRRKGELESQIIAPRGGWKLHWHWRDSFNGLWAWMGSWGWCLLTGRCDLSFTVFPAIWVLTILWRNSASKNFVRTKRMKT